MDRHCKGCVHLDGTTCRYQELTANDYAVDVCKNKKYKLVRVQVGQMVQRSTKGRPGRGW